MRRFDEARAAFDKSLQLKLDGPEIRIARYQLAFLQNDDAAMKAQVNWITNKGEVEDQILAYTADTEAYHGRLSRARDLCQRAVATAQRHDSKEAAAIWGIVPALYQPEFGYSAESRTAVADALALSSDHDVSVLAALALAAAGDNAQAQKIADRLNQESPLDTLLQGYWLPTIRAQIAVNNGDAHRAINLLKDTLPYEIGAPPPVQVGTLYPAYVRGKAYLKLGQGADAAANFQKFFDYRGIVINFSFASLAHFQAGRAYALSGDNAKARMKYQDFFALWKDADADIPILKQARLEYEKLK